MIHFYSHRDCYGLQFLRVGSWTASIWVVPRSTKLAPHTHPGQHVVIIPLFCIRTTFNRCRIGEYPQGVETFKAWPLNVYETPDGYFHFANKGSENKPRRGPFIFLNMIKWWDGKPRHPKDGFELVDLV